MSSSASEASKVWIAPLKWAPRASRPVYDVAQLMRDPQAAAARQVDGAEILPLHLYVHRLLPA